MTTTTVDAAPFDIDLKEKVCPLCHNDNVALYSQDKKRPYLQCQQCDLVFVPKSFHLSAAEEKLEYDLHQNLFNDSGYVRFLSRCFDPVVQSIGSNGKGLDYGCGPAPVLAKMFVDAGYEMSVYDLFYWPDDSVLDSSYDFICSTEVVEHVSQPDKLFDRFSEMLNQDGILAIMTKRVIDQEAFKLWHYKNDPTHICFYSDKTFDWLAKRYQLRITHKAPDVVLLEKPAH